VLLFRQFVNEDLGCASYLVGDSEAGVAVVVDPPFAVDELVALTRQLQDLRDRLKAAA
jgi:glyoxylase-like metal-dependent hydrolase (beta-lactamase superfamily II)